MPGFSIQVIGIGRAPAVRLTIALTTLALAHTYTGWTWAGHVPGQARPGLRYATGFTTYVPANSWMMNSGVSSD